MKNKIICILILVLVFYSCKEKSIKGELSTKSTQKEVQQLTNTDESSEGTFLFSGEDEVILNWTKVANKKRDNILKFAFFNKNTGFFSKPIVVTPSKGLQIHAESMAKVASTKDGILYAFFRIKATNSKSMFGGAIYYAISADKGQTWSDKRKLVTDKESTSQSFYDVAQLPDGELGLVWLDNRKLHKNRKGQTLYFSKTNGTEGFQNEIALEGSVCQCCRTDIQVAINGSIHIAFRNMIEPDEVGYPKFLKGSENEIRDMHYISSKNNGKTFTKSILISDDNWQVNGCPHTGPSLANTNTSIGAVWFTAANTNAGLFFTSKIDDSFNERELVSKEGKHPQMISINNHFYIVFEEYYELESKGYTRIILQERTSDEIIKTTEISAPKTDNNHPVLKTINDNEILISWTNNDVRNSVIQYKLYNIAN